MVLPEGFALPPVHYLLSISVVLVAVVVVLWTMRPAVTDRTVLAVVPWMVAGGAAHVLYIVGALPAALEPLFGLPSVYLTMGAAAGLAWVLSEVWASARTTYDASTVLLGVGVVAAVVALLAVISWGASAGELSLWWPVVGLVVAIFLTAVAWWLVHQLFPDTAAITAWTGVVVLFGHSLDGISTAIGIDILGRAERSPVADAILWVGSQLPTADLIGDAWLFVLVKLALPIAVLILFRDYLHEAPDQARLLLALIAAVGLGPGVYNLLLFSISL